MDPIVIATVINRPLFFLAKGVLFKSRFSKWLFSKFHMIPIFRADETPGQEEKNKEVFSHCYKHFAMGGAILVFPEGVSLTGRELKKIKTGAARIALGAEAENNFSLDLKVVSIGLNFSNPHQFQSDLFVNIDKPISVSDYFGLYAEDAFKAASSLTDEIRTRLETQVVAIQDSEIDTLVANIENVYKSQLLKDLGHSPQEMEGDFKTTKGISDSVHYFLEFEPLRVEKFKQQINKYLSDLERLSLNDSLIKGAGKESPFFDAIKTLVYLVVGFPFFIFGTINNYLPFKIPGWLAGALAKRPEFIGSISITMERLHSLFFTASKSF